MLQLLALGRNVHFRAFYDEDLFCGLLYTMENEKYVFVLYLAVNDRIRSKGYGSRILQWLQGHTSKVLVLNVEALREGAPNAEQRERRIAFYSKNGILNTGCTFEDAGETYAVLSSNPERFRKEEYERLLRQFGYKREICGE